MPELAPSPRVDMLTGHKRITAQTKLCTFVSGPKCSITCKLQPNSAADASPPWQPDRLEGMGGCQEPGQAVCSWSLRPKHPHLPAHHYHPKGHLAWPSWVSCQLGRSHLGSSGKLEGPWPESHLLLAQGSSSSGRGGGGAGLNLPLGTPRHGGLVLVSPCGHKTVVAPLSLSGNGNGGGNHPTPTHALHLCPGNRDAARRWGLGGGGTAMPHCAKAPHLGVWNTHTCRMTSIPTTGGPAFCNAYNSLALKSLL